MLHIALFATSLMICAATAMAGKGKADANKQSKNTERNPAAAAGYDHCTGKGLNFNASKSPLLKPKDGSSKCFEVAPPAESLIFDMIRGQGTNSRDLAEYLDKNGQTKVFSGAELCGNGRSLAIECTREVPLTAPRVICAVVCQ